MIQKVFVIGATGKVGSEVVKQIIRNGDNNPNIHKNPTRIVGLASKGNGFIYSDDGILDHAAMAFANRKVNGHLFGKLSNLTKVVGSPTVFVDLTALDTEMLDFHKEIIFRADHSIVTANKFPLTLCTFKEFKKLTADYERYGFSASVNAGAGSVNWLRNCYDLNDHVITIQGCFSGTLRFIKSEIANGRSFSVALSRAIKLGYTEPDPIEDLKGRDVLRKAVILARAAGIDVEDRITHKPFVADWILNSESLKRFIKDGTVDETLDRFDYNFCRVVTAKENDGKSREYVATVFGKNGKEKSSIVVEPMFIDRTQGLGTLKGTANKVIITTEAYSNGWAIEAPGAGITVTARNVRADLLERLRGRQVKV